MMKKTLSLLLCLVLVLACCSASAEDATVETRDSIVVGSMSQITGYFFTDLWSNNTADVDVRAMIHGQSTISWTYNGEYVLDQSIIAEVATTQDPAGNVTYTCTLSDLLAFSNGDPITAYDYAFSVLLLSSPLLGELGVLNDSYGHLLGGAEYASGESDVFTGVRVIDEDTFSLTIRADALPYYYELMYVDVTPYPISVLMPGCVVRDDGEGAYIDDTAVEGGATVEMLEETILDPETGYMTHPSITSGPYVLVSYDADTHVAEFEINEYYPGNFEGQKPSIAHVSYKPANKDTMLEGLANGEFDIINKVTDGSIVTDGLARSAEGQMSASNYLRSGFGFVSFACERAPMDSLALRKAVALCIDAEGFCNDFLQGYGLPVYGYYGYGQWMVTMSTEALPELNLYAINPNAAKFTLIDDGWTLNEAGGAFVEGTDAVRYKDVDGTLTSLTIRLAISENSGAAQELVEMLRENLSPIGVELLVTEMPYSELLNHYYRKTDREYDMFFLATNFAHVFDPYYIYNTDPSYQGVINTTGLVDPEMEALAKDMRETQSDDTEGYLAKWMNFQKHWVDVLPCAPIYSNVYFDFYTPELYEYAPNTHWSWASSIVYATFEEPVEELPEDLEGIEEGELETFE